MSENLDQSYWQERYLSADTPWDMGKASPPLITYLEEQDRKSKILIPGAGRAWEAEWLVEQGFEQVEIIDLSSQALEEAQSRLKGAEKLKWINGDFFELQESYELIAEQTFFCALKPQLRVAYAQKMKSLLKPGGRLFGVLFNFPLSEAGPPYGGSPEEYRALFEPHFEIKHLEPCFNSIKPRRGREVFIELIA